MCSKDGCFQRQNSTSSTPPPPPTTHTYPPTPTTTQHTQIEALEQRTTDAALFLPPYDVRRAHEEAQTLRGKLEAARAALAPRKKFSFSARRQQRGSGGGGDSTSASAGQEQASPLSPSASSAAAASVAALSLRDTQQPPPQGQEAAAAPAREGFEGREGEELELGPDPPKDLLLKDLRRCTVRL
jgi:hypothetical protein